MFPLFGIRRSTVTYTWSHTSTMGWLFFSSQQCLHNIYMLPCQKQNCRPPYLKPQSFFLSTRRRVLCRAFDWNTTGASQTWKKIQRLLKSRTSFLKSPRRWHQQNTQYTSHWNYVNL